MLSIASEATGEFDPLGTLVTLLLLAAFAYVAYVSWNRLGTATGIKLWLFRAGVLGGGLMAILISISFVLNLAGALGIL